MQSVARCRRRTSFIHRVLDVIDSRTTRTVLIIYKYNGSKQASERASEQVSQRCCPRGTVHRSAHSSSQSSSSSSYTLWHMCMRLGTTKRVSDRAQQSSSHQLVMYLSFIAIASVEAKLLRVMSSTLDRSTVLSSGAAALSFADCSWSRKPPPLLPLPLLPAGGGGGAVYVRETEAERERERERESTCTQSSLSILELKLDTST
jgi:hypothetical protein